MQCLRCGGNTQQRALGLLEGSVFGKYHRCSSCCSANRRAKRWVCTQGCSFNVCDSCFSHMPISEAPSLPSSSARLACRYGTRCYQTNSQHITTFAHPGDHDYRQGLVKFEEGQHPDLSTLWDIFTFFDPQRSGHLCYHAFISAASELGRIVSKDVDSEQGWLSTGGAERKHISFVPFASWAGLVASRMPVGLDMEVGCMRRCNVVLTDGRCTCQDFVPADLSTARICRCGHYEHAHRSDSSQLSLGAQLLSSRPSHWKPGVIGLTPITDPMLLDQFQFLLSQTHKETDNWTRDRGCRLHGVNRCKPPCIYKNKAPVPTGYCLSSVYRNQNPGLWARYSLMRSTIVHECALESCKPLILESSKKPFDRIDGQHLVRKVNECRVFHGTSHESCLNICKKNFSLECAGTGATWKDLACEFGQPLYGYGIYFAERMTKADEYCTRASVPDGKRPPTFHVLVCRVVAGHATLCTKNEIDSDKLRSQVLDGPHHSIVGDRTKELGKPYRELVIYDKDQIFPEFLVEYTRVYEDA